MLETLFPSSHITNFDQWHEVTLKIATYNCTYENTGWGRYILTVWRDCLWLLFWSSQKKEQQEIIYIESRKDCFLSDGVNDKLGTQ